MHQILATQPCCVLLLLLFLLLLLPTPSPLPLTPFLLLFPILLLPSLSLLLSYFSFFPFLSFSPYILLLSLSSSLWSPTFPLLSFIFFICVVMSKLSIESCAFSFFRCQWMKQPVSKHTDQSKVVLGNLYIASSCQAAHTTQGPYVRQQTWKCSRNM